MIHKRQAAAILGGGKPTDFTDFKTGIIIVLYTNNLRFITVQIVYFRLVTV